VSSIETIICGNGARDSAIYKSSVVGNSALTLWTFFYNYSIFAIFNHPLHY